MIFFLVHKVTMGFAVIGVINGSLTAFGRPWLIRRSVFCSSGCFSNLKTGKNKKRTQDP